MNYNFYDLINEELLDDLQTCEKLAKENNINAIANCALIYYTKFKDEDYENNDYTNLNICKKYLKQAIDLGNIDACVECADICIQMDEFEEAVKHYQMAIDRGRDEVLILLGDVYYQNGDKDSAMNFYNIALEKKIFKALICIGELHFENEEYEIALDYFNKAIEKGCNTATYALSNCENEISISNNKAEDTYSNQLDNTQSIVNLAFCYEYGIGVNQDIDKANEYYKQAADLGNADAYYYLAKVNFDMNTEEDFIYGLDLCRKAADLGNADACLTTANIAHANLDFELSFKYAKLAFDKGNNSAAKLLAEHYLTGVYVEKDFNLYVDYLKIVKK